MFGNRAYVWDSIVALRSLIGTSDMSFPSKSTRPESGLVRPQIILSAVVFPAPVGPRRHRYSPSLTVRQRSSDAETSPNDLRM